MLHLSPVQCLMLALLIERERVTYDDIAAACIARWGWATTFGTCQTNIVTFRARGFAVSGTLRKGLSLLPHARAEAVAALAAQSPLPAEYARLDSFRQSPGRPCKPQTEPVPHCAPKPRAQRVPLVVRAGVMVTFDPCTVRFGERSDDVPEPIAQLVAMCLRHFPSPVAREDLLKVHGRDLDALIESAATALRGLGLNLRRVEGPSVKLIIPGAMPIARRTIAAANTASARLTQYWAARRAAKEVRGDHVV